MLETTVTYGVRRALNELTAILDGQWANGMLPHVRYVTGQNTYRPDAPDWGIPPHVPGATRVATSGITQPPIVARCAEIVFHRLPRPSPYVGDFLTLEAALERFHHFLLTERSPLGDGLVVSFHPWETGTDNSPAFEPLLQQTRAYLAEHHIDIDTFDRADTEHVQVEHRPTAKDYVVYFGLIALFSQWGYDQARIAAESPFLLQDVLINATLVDSLDALASLQTSLAKLTGAPYATPLFGRAAANRARRDRLAESIRQHLWSEEDGFFYARDARHDRLIPTATVSSFMPLLAGIASPDQGARLLAHLTNPDEFKTPFPVPSTSPQAPLFDPQRYWTGPSWPVPNWFLARALRDHDTALAASLRASTLRMIAEDDGDPSRWRERAAQVMAYNSVGDWTTTPSRQQYQHAWLWDSAIAAVGWTHVDDTPPPFDPASSGPQFWEYYHPMTGEPLGARLMTWTAAVFLDLLDDGRWTMDDRRPTTDDRRPTEDA